MEQTKQTNDVYNTENIENAMDPRYTELKKIRIADFLHGDDHSNNMEVLKHMMKFREPALRSNSNSGNAIKNVENCPRLEKLPSDMIQPLNLNMPKTVLAELFDQRRHHEHHDPCQHKELLVDFRLKIPSNVAKNTQCEEVEELEKSPEKPSVCEEHFPQSFETENVVDGKKLEYLRKIHETFNEIKKSLEGVKSDNETFKLDEKSINAINREIDSMQSCVSSKTSSICTNFTNDSGSFLNIDETKVPMRYITKSWVPFEETDRRRVIAKRFENSGSKSVYFRTPYSGQYLEMAQSMQVKDNGCTRFDDMVLSDGAVENLGVEGNEFPVMFATDLDRNYVKDIRSRGVCGGTKPSDTVAMARKILRQTIDTMLTEEIILDKMIEDEIDAQFERDLKQWQNVSETLLSELVKDSQNRMLASTNSLEAHLKLTEDVEKRHEKAKIQFEKIKRDIFSAETELRNHTISQKLHYLLMNEEWRRENDLLHKKGDGTIEEYREANANRNVTHMRRIDNENSAWSVKEFYENHFFNKIKPLTVFPTANALLTRIDTLKQQNIERAQILNKYANDLDVLKNQFRQVQTEAHSNSQICKSKMIPESSKTEFLNKRLIFLKHHADSLIDKPLVEAISDELMLRVTALCDVLFRHVIPSGIRELIKEDATAIEKFEMIVSVVWELLWKLDGVPNSIQSKGSRRVRTNRGLIKRQSTRAYELETRIKQTMNGLKKSLQPPPKPDKKEGKLRRMYLRRKIVKVEIPPPVVPKSVKLFHKAFVHSGQELIMENIFNDPTNAKLIKSIEPNSEPFYFDHFLKLRGHQPDANIRTQVEVHDGPEENRFKFKDIADKVIKQHNILIEIEKEKKINVIENTAHLYESY